MWQGPPTLLGQAQSQITQPHASSYHRNTSTINGYILKRLETDNHTAILASRTERSVRMSTALGLHLDAKANGAQDGIGDLQMGFWEDDDGWSVLKTDVV